MDIKQYGKINEQTALDLYLKDYITFDETIKGYIFKDEVRDRSIHEFLRDIERKFKLRLILVGILTMLFLGMWVGYWIYLFSHPDKLGDLSVLIAILLEVIAYLGIVGFLLIKVKCYNHQMALLDAFYIISTNTSINKLNSITETQGCQNG